MKTIVILTIALVALAFVTVAFPDWLNFLNPDWGSHIKQATSWVVSSVKVMGDWLAKLLRSA